jgi:hypothetical protein
MGIQDDLPHPVLVLGATGGQGWTSFTTWAERTFRPAAPAR